VVHLVNKSDNQQICFK